MYLFHLHMFLLNMYCMRFTHFNWHKRYCVIFLIMLLVSLSIAFLRCSVCTWSIASNFCSAFLGVPLNILPICCPSTEHSNCLQLPITNNTASTYGLCEMDFILSEWRTSVHQRLTFIKLVFLKWQRGKWYSQCAN